MFFKSLDGNLQARNGFQYEIGGDFTADTDDPWHLLHFARRVTHTLPYNGRGIRIVEVKPIGDKNVWSSADMNSKSLHVVRELGKDEIFERLIEEKCPVWRMMIFEPPYDLLLKLKEQKKIHRSDYSAILGCDHLSAEEKKSLLPKSWGRAVDIRMHRL